MNSELKRLIQLDKKIQKIAKEFGLNFFPQEFDVVSAEKMLEILAYHFPVNFSHWSFGRDARVPSDRWVSGFKREGERGDTGAQSEGGLAMSPTTRTQPLRRPPTSPAAVIRRSLFCLIFG